MEQTTISVGMLMYDKEKECEWRLVGIHNKLVSLIKVRENGKFVNKRFDTEILELSQVRQYINTHSFIVIHEKVLDFSVDNLTDEEKSLFEKKRDMVFEVMKIYGPFYSRLARKEEKKELKSIIKLSGLSYDGGKKVILRYLQSGFKEVALMPNYRKMTCNKDVITYTKKTGRPARIKFDIDGSQLPIQGKILDEKDIKNFELYIKRYLGSEVSTINDAYDEMINEKYHIEVKTNEGFKPVELPEDQKPTIWQFYNYMKKKTTIEERVSAKKTERVVRNDKRVFTGSVMDGVRGPGDVVEIDAHEIDLSIVSDEYPDICIGRPILYLMIDVFTRTILAFAVALDNNSIVGCTNLFFNLVEDKVALFKKYGTTFELKDGLTMDDIWPSNILPSSLRYDRGSELISDEINRIMNELNIKGDPVPPASGSLKPVVERYFKKIKERLQYYLEHHGLIRKVYGSKHHKESCLDIKDVNKIILDCILCLNTEGLRRYKRSADMKKKGILPIPYMLWKYGCENLMNPLIIGDKDAFIYHIMKPIPENEVMLSRQGIEYKDLVYFNDADLHTRMFNAQDNKENFECRLDPRDCGHLYYMNHGLKTVRVNTTDPIMRGYNGMSWRRYEEISKDDTRIADTLKYHNDRSRRSQSRRTKQTVKEAASRKNGPSETKNMRKNRKDAKEKIQTEMSVANKFPELITEQKGPAPLIAQNTNVSDFISLEQSSVRDPLEIKKQMMEKARTAMLEDDD